MIYYVVSTYHKGRFDFTFKTNPRDMFPHTQWDLEDRWSHAAMKDKIKYLK